MVVSVEALADVDTGERYATGGLGDSAGVSWVGRAGMAGAGNTPSGVRDTPLTTLRGSLPPTLQVPRAQSWGTFASQVTDCTPRPFRSTAPEGTRML